MKAILVTLVLVLLTSGIGAADETTYNVPALIDDLKDEFDWEMIGMYNHLATPIDWILYV